MTIRTRILLVYLLIVGGGFYYLLQRSLDELAPRYLESMEESLADTVNILASAVESVTDSDTIDPARLQSLFDGAYGRRFDARIYTLTKTRVDLRVYVADAAGRVIYDSAGRDTGADFSTWLDVSKTLRGEYGARATHERRGDPSSFVIYIAAPVKSRADPARAIGVVSVGKPTVSINSLVEAARKRMFVAGLIGGGLILAVGIAFSIWITTPLARLTAYARAVRDGRPASLPRLAGREVGELRQAFEEMRAALEGKTYVERYVQTLTHEIKSPLSAIRGAAEILAENPPADARDRFVGNIRTETARVQRIVDQLLQLAALESRKARAESAHIDLAAIARECAAAAEPAAQARGIALSLDAVLAPLRGDKNLLAQALSNLLQNAIEFTPAGGRIAFTVAPDPQTREVFARIEDTGPGIPDYAAGRLFDRFYSLPRPDSGAKSTGLGLSLVREIAHLHSGEITVANRPGGMPGTRAELRLPRRAV
jgi:two-component system sensor histidine kinase CreC